MLKNQQFQLISIVFLITCFLVGCNSDKNKTQEAENADSVSNTEVQESPKAYSVLVLASRPITLYLDFPATLQGQQNIEIRPKVDGYLEAIHVDEGAMVKKGQALFRINAPQYTEAVRTAQAGIETAQADVNSAQMVVNKVRPLVEKDIISEYELESAQYTLQSKIALLTQAKANLANAKTNLAYTYLSSPVSGVVGSIPYKIGSLVSSTTTNPLTIISDISSVYAYFSVNEKQLLTFTRDISGNTLQDKLAKLPDVLLLLADGSLYNQKGRVKTAIGQIDTETGSLSFRATFQNPQSLLRSGNSGTIRIPRSLSAALVIPQSATYELQGKRFLYTVGNDGVIKNTEVTVTPTPDGRYFVVQEGLKAGDQVVLDGISQLKDGIKIKPQVVQDSAVYQGNAL